MKPTAKTSQVKAGQPAPAKVKKSSRSPRARNVTAVIDDIASPIDSDLMGMTPREARFVDIYVQTFNASQSYLDAGYQCKPSVAGSLGSRMLKNAKVAPFVAARIKAMLDDSAQHQAALMRALMYSAFADVRELVEFHRGACRYCHGKLGRYQYTAGEWDAIMTKHAEKQEKAAENDRPMPPEPDPKGGTGYTWGKAPNPGCTECAGVGAGKVIVHDTRNLSASAVAIYAGVKEGKDGIEVKLQDKSKALDTLVKIAKLYEDTTSVNVSMNAAELDAVYGEAMRKGAERMERMRAERRAAREARGD